MVKLISVIKNINNKRLLFCGVILFIVLLSTFVGVIVFQFYLRDFKDTTDNREYDKYYVLITEDRNSEFWQSVYQGAYEAGIDDGVYVELLGENLSKEYTKEELMSIAIAEEVDGIMVDADTSSQMSLLINEAMKNKIPVVTVYNDNTSSKRLSFVGIANYTMGRVYGGQVLQLAEKVKREKPSKTGVCNVDILVTAYADQTWQNILCSAIQETVNQDKYEAANINIRLVPVNNSTKFSAEESIRDIFMKNDQPDIIVCLNELNTSCVYQAVVDYNKVGEVRVLGYYDLESTLKAVERGVVDATISLNTKQMGKYCTEALQEYYINGKVSEYFAADVSLINSNNVSKFMEERQNENRDKKD